MAVNWARVLIANIEFVVVVLYVEPAQFQKLGDATMAWPTFHLDHDVERIRNV